MQKVRDGSSKILVAASGGGHWDELMLLRPALDRFDPVYVTTNARLAARDRVGDIRVLPDANRDQLLKGFCCFFAAFKLIMKEKPDVVLSTGALPGLFCLIIGRLLGARTIWVDSIANSDAPSLSGRIARPFSSLWITQWEHLAGTDNARYFGALL